MERQMRKSLIDWCIKNHREYLLDEWDTDKNGILDRNISYGSENKILWKCSKGHSWLASINSRTSNLTHCPFCSGRFAIEGETDLGTTHKYLISEWMFAKNEKITPYNVKSNSHYKVWWKCITCGHEWKAVISSRANGCGCPECGKVLISKARSLPNQNNLLTKHNKELLKEWNTIKNGELTPDMFSAGSHRKVWWKCNLGHEWESSIANRIKGRGCPYCSGKSIMKGFNDLETINPELASEWHPLRNGNLKPTDVAPHSNKKVWWKCKKGHEWEATVNNRTKRNCPECSKELRISYPEKAVYYYILKVFANSIENYHPENFCGKELDIFIPEIKVAIEYDGEAFHKTIENDLEKDRLCKENKIKLIRIREPNCPMLNSTSVCFILPSRSERNLENIIKNVITQIMGNAKKSLRNMPLININNDSKEIYELMNYMDKKNALFYTNPELVKEWHPTKNGELKPMKVTKGSDKKVWWICSNNHEWQASISHRVAGRGCPICNNKKIEAGINDITTIAPHLMEEWDYEKNKGINPKLIGGGSNIKAWWICSVCGTEWKTYVNSRIKGSNCPMCLKNKLSAANSKPKTGNSLAEVFPEIALQWNYEKNEELNPKDVSAKSGKKVWWKCKNGHEWEATVSSRQKTSCPYCSNRVLVRGLNDLLTINPKLATEWHPTKNGALMPSDVAPNSNKKVWWKCKNGHEWESTVNNRNRGRGCRRCRKEGKNVNTT